MSESEDKTAVIAVLGAEVMACRARIAALEQFVTTEVKTRCDCDYAAQVEGVHVDDCISIRAAQLLRGGKTRRVPPSRPPPTTVPSGGEPRGSMPLFEALFGPWKK